MTKIKMQPAQPMGGAGARTRGHTIMWAAVILALVLSAAIFAGVFGPGA